LVHHPPFPPPNSPDYLNETNIKGAVINQECYDKILEIKQMMGLQHNPSGNILMFAPNKTACP